MAERTSIFLHAELLPNIRQLTVHVSLPSRPADVDLRSSTITLSESRRAITVYTTRGIDDEKQEFLETLKLPARVAESSRRNLSFAGHQVDTLQDANSTDYSFRLQVDDYDNASKLSNNGLHEDDFVPWTANDMLVQTALHCRFCRELILGSLEHGTTKWTWKDLPSGNWAEMMDFWHCHKPDVHADEKDQQRVIDDQSASVKGYGASNRVIALTGTVLIDVASFLVAEGDCQNIKRFQVSDATPLAPLTAMTRANIQCKQCGVVVGMEDPMADGLRLYKSNISVRHPSALGHPENPIFESYVMDMFISAQLLELINREGVRRFVIHAGNLDGLLVWAFNPDLRYSSASADHSIITERAMKVLYQAVPNVEKILEPEKGTAVPLSLEELYLPATIYDEFLDSLKRSNGILPGSARTFREWNVAFLRRYERVP
ncbi:ubiquitin-conjugating enzyme E2-binding protein [Talaromyces proteolyticus]|uniref:Ubiquitin-conjugating enzyme E2-binding protein n=1 Tax=Talaromyces proteolyticus TaxID=1131652 RepID=A0AAD4KLP1_9EURO|nr:ubiquitin-conjugating enzyme E2-binding protein [Talaromyces proteolyticus]KAH8694069.1 ubiquitin-conjugating enzyme E2-binding protein [Talaromyces proteolyticus]